MAYRKRFVLGDERVNSYGTWLLSSGAKMDDFKKNAPAFYDHRTWELPVGHWENISLNKETNQWEADIVIEGGNDYEKDVIRKIENGDIKGASFGADVIETSVDPKYLKPEQIRATITKWSPYEASITPLPANANALVLRSNEKGIQLSFKASDDTISQILPIINISKNMKKVMLKLGLKEDASEDEAVAAIEAISNKVDGATALQSTIDTLAEKVLDEKELALFKELSKTSPEAANKVLTLSKAKDDTKKEKVSNILEAAKLLLGKKDQESSDEETFDFLQKNNPEKLLNLKRTDTEKYQKLVSDHLKRKPTGK